MIKRTLYLDRIEKSLSDRQTILFLVGGRQVGKTTLLQSLFAYDIIKKEESLWVDGDRLLSYDFEQGNSFLQYLERLQDISQLKYLIIDEVQYIKHIGLILKHLIDDIRRGLYNFKILVSGSGTLQVFQGLTDTLTGRKEIIEVFPFSFQEFVEAKGQRWIPKAINLPSYLQLFEEYTLFGGYPAVVTTRDPREKMRKLEQLLQDYIFRDVLLLIQQGEIMNFRKFLQVVAGKLGNPVSVETLVQESGMSRYMTEKYLFVIENTFMVGKVNSYVGGKISGEIKKLTKWYFYDIGMLRILLGGQEWVGDYKGKMVENFVYNQILVHKKSSQVLHYRHTKQNSEIDFIIVDNFIGKIIPIEVKSGNKQQLYQSFIHFIQQYHDRISAGYYTSEQQYHTRIIEGVSIQFLPFLYLVDAL